MKNKELAELYRTIADGFAKLSEYYSSEDAEQPKAVKKDKPVKTEKKTETAPAEESAVADEETQMKDWLISKGVETDSLDKKAVIELLKTVPSDVADVLKLRQQLAKSSVKKYQAMQNSVCADGRAKGMFQFYGANRSGRWAGRIIQLQNLPQNHMTDLEDARDIVKSGDYELMNMLYDDVPDALSQLIRTAFIPKLRYKFCVSDFSAIEARVIAFLAKENWRMKVFKENGYIYCTSASAISTI